MKFKELCEQLNERHFIQCLRAILEILCDVMVVHYGIIQYHDEKELNLNAVDPKKKYLSEIRDG